MQQMFRVFVLASLFVVLMGPAVAQDNSESRTPDQQPQIIISQKLLPAPPGSISAGSDSSISFYGSNFEYRRFTCKADVPGWSETSVTFWADAKIEITGSANRRYFRDVTGTGWNYKSGLGEITGNASAQIQSGYKKLKIRFDGQLKRYIAGNQAKAQGLNFSCTARVF